jgi:glycosyltransferase involved in cell wall biosynthesis
MHFDPGAGGADRYFAGLCGILHERQADFRAAAFGEAPDRADAISLGASNSSVVQRWNSIRKLLVREAPQSSVIASHFALYAVPLLTIRRRPAHVVHFHGPWAAESAGEGASPRTVAIKKAVERLVFSRSHRFIVLSTAFRDILVKDYACPESHVHVIPPGVQLDRFLAAPSRSEARQRLGLPADRRIIVCVRRLTKRMGLENLIAAMTRLRMEMPDVLLVIAGRGPLSDALNDRIQSSGLTSHVRLAGFVPDADLPAFYAAGDVSVVPSVALEGFGLITAESLAAGTPCLVTPVGGLPEAVSGLHKNLVFASTSQEAIQAGIRTALDQPFLNTLDCRQYAIRSFDWNLALDRILSVYKRAVEER